MTGHRVAAVVAALALVTGGCAGSQQQRQPSAADQVPQLSVVLQHVDAALAAHRFGAARQQLRLLKADVVKARDAGELRDDDAQRVLDAVARLLGMVPEPSPSASATPEQATPSTSGPARPSTSHSATPRQPTTTSVSPTSTPTPTSSPSSTPTSSPDSSPTAGLTGDASPTAATTSGP